MEKTKFPPAERLGKRITYLRKERHMSQLDLSIDSEIAKTYICDLEKGRRNPTLGVLCRLCAALRVSLEELFRDI